MKYLIWSLVALTLALHAIGAQAADTLIYKSTQGRPDLILPYIGTPEYSDSCSITHAWEDHSAIAYCSEGGATYVYDPDGQYVPGIASNPVRDPGWYVQ